MIKKRVYRIASLLVLITSVLLASYWLNIEWWKCLILYILFGWALNIDNTSKELKHD